MALTCAQFAHAGELADQPATGQQFDCLLEPRVTVKLGAAVTGMISKVHVDRGDLVKAGQIVANLEAEVQEAIVELARIRASNNFQMRAQSRRTEFLNRKADRLQLLRRNEVSSVAALDEAQTEAGIAEQTVEEAKLNLEVAQAELRREEASLNQRTVRSPIDGVVTERTLSSGEYRNETSHIMTIAELNPLNVETFLPVSLYGKITVGSSIEVQPELRFGGSFYAKVVVIDRVLDAASGTFGVRLELPNPDYRLPAGIRCKVVF
jgi:RND family efflux transporter MFP subunit